MAIKNYTVKPAARSLLAQMVTPDMVQPDEALQPPPSKNDQRMTLLRQLQSGLAPGTSGSFEGEDPVTSADMIKAPEMAGFKFDKNENGNPVLNKEQFNNPEADLIRKLRAEIAARPIEPDLRGAAAWVNFRNLNPGTQLNLPAPDHGNTQEGHDEAAMKLTAALAEQEDKKQAYQAKILSDLMAVKGKPYKISASHTNPPASGGIQDRMDQKMVEAYSKRLEKLAPLDAAFKSVEDLTNADGKGGVLTNKDAKLISGGKLEALIPNKVIGFGDALGITDSGAANERAALSQISQFLGKVISGTAMTDSERKNIKEAQGWLASGDPELQAKGVRRAAQIQKKEHTVTKGGYNSNVKELYQIQSGENPTELYDRLYADPANNSESAANAPAVSGSVVLKREYSPSRNQTRITYSDGRVEIKDGQ